MLTDRGIGLAGGAVACWLAARGFGVAELQMVAVGAVGLLVGAVLLTRLTPARLRVERTVRPARLFHDAEARVEAVVVNASRLPTASLTLEDRLPAGLQSHGTRVDVGHLRPRARVRLTYHVRARGRGRHEIGPLQLHVRDPFGLVSRRLTRPGTVEAVVYPRLWRLPVSAPLGGAAPTGSAGRPRQLADGEELANVREYVRGDDLRKVHWPTTAHRGTLMVRQPEAPRDPRAVVWLDRDARAHRGESLEAAVSAAASAVRHLAEHDRDAVVVDGPMAATPAPRPWQAWLAHLAEVEAAEVDAPATLRRLAVAAGGESLLLAVAPVPDEPRREAMVRAGRAFGVRLAVLVDAESHVGGRDARGPAASAALRAAGWHVTVLAADDSLPQRWAELARRAERGPQGAAT